MQGNLSIERMCPLGGVSRAGFYRSLQERQPIEEDMEVRSTIQLVFAEHKRRYGYRRVSEELRRRGMRVNHKRVPRLREDNLLAAAEGFRNYNGFRSRPGGVSQPSQPDETHWHQPALGGRHHFHPAAS